MSAAATEGPWRDPSRRQFLAAGAALATTHLLPRGAYAGEVHRFSHGDFEVAILSDGFIMLPAEVLLPDAAPEDRPRILERLGGPRTAPPSTSTSR